jgi:hypothetical protein
MTAQMLRYGLVDIVVYVTFVPGKLAHLSLSHLDVIFCVYTRTNNKHWHSVFRLGLGHSIVTTTGTVRVSGPQTSLWASLKHHDPDHRSFLSDRSDR